MPIPTPAKGEDKKKFLSRCIGFLRKEGKEAKQAAAICYSQLKEGKKQKKIIKEIDTLLS